MHEHSVTFLPQNKTVRVPADASLLEAAHQAHITINNLCGGDGICGRCKMIVVRGEVSGAVSAKLTREEIRQGYVLACQTAVNERPHRGDPGRPPRPRKRPTPPRTRSAFATWWPEFEYDEQFVPAPLVDKVYLAMEPPDAGQQHRRPPAPGRGHPPQAGPPVDADGAEDHPEPAGRAARGGLQDHGHGGPAAGHRRGDERGAGRHLRRRTTSPWWTWAPPPSWPTWWKPTP